MSEPNTVELTSRKVIERKLLTALEEGNQVAILASKQDLEDMIAALYGYELGEWIGSNTLSWEAHLKRRRALADGMAQLLKEAFSTPSTIGSASSSR